MAYVFDDAVVVNRKGSDIRELFFYPGLLLNLGGVFAAGLGTDEADE